MLIVIIQECHKEVTRISMRAENVALNLLAYLEEIGNGSWREYTLARAWEIIEQWVVECGINADGVPFFRMQCIAPNKVGDGLLAIIYLAEREKVLFANTEREFAYVVGKIAREIRTDVLQRIDAKAINVIFCNQILVSAS